MFEILENSNGDNVTIAIVESYPLALELITNFNSIERLNRERTSYIIRKMDDCQNGILKFIL